MSITVGETFAQLSSGRRWYAYSGIILGTVGAPAFITMTNIPNIGLRDTFIKVQPFFGPCISNAFGDALGIEITIDGITVLREQGADPDIGILPLQPPYELFIPKSSSLLIESRNTLANNTQERGCNVLGWYMHGSDH